ncbi:MAG TPA: transposase [Fluviicoccus sp.]|nr:transposase [Fluviicoccus sp.]
MPRRPRLVLPGTPLHIIQRGHNRNICFPSQDDHAIYLSWLSEYAKTSGCQVHSYVLMTNHVHLLLTPAAENSAADLMQSLGQRYTQHINRTYARTGTLWEGRFKSGLVQDRHYLLKCMRYIELNPVRADMVQHPAEYRWSSYRSNAQGDADDVLTPHAEYLQLSGDDATRALAYRELFRMALEPGLADQIRQATNSNLVLGHPVFAEQVEALLKQKTVLGKPGRPPRNIALSPI